MICVPTAVVTCIVGIWLPTLRLPRAVLITSLVAIALTVLTVCGNLGGAWLWFLD